MRRLGYLLFLSMFIFASCSLRYPSSQEIVVQQLSKNRTYSKGISNQLEEISGLLIHSKEFIGFNDSGGEAAIYFVPKHNPHLISKTIYFKNTLNSDFEAIAEDNNYFYIGDFGNNRGNRRDLKVYKLDKNQITSDSVQSINVEAINFTFPEQVKFDNKGYDHNFDVEGMFYNNGKLHLFTKEWQRKFVTHYTLDITEQNQKAIKIEDYNTSFVVTGADYIDNEETKKVALTGYTRKGQVFLIIFESIAESDKFFDVKPLVYRIGFSGKVGQIEGIAFKSFNEVCWSAERFKKGIFDVKQHISCAKLN